LCDANKTDQAGNNWKITVPFNQELQAESKDLLETYVSPVIDYVSPLQHFWEENKIYKDLGRIIFIVDKQSILKVQYNELIAVIDRLKTNPDLVVAFQGRIDIAISGYDGDIREL